MSDQPEVRVVDVEQQREMLRAYETVQAVRWPQFTKSMSAHQFESRLCDLDDIVSAELDARLLEAINEEADVEAVLAQIAGTPFQDVEDEDEDEDVEDEE